MIYGLSDLDFRGYRVWSLEFGVANYLKFSEPIQFYLKKKVQGEVRLGFLELISVQTRIQVRYPKHQTRNTTPPRFQTYSLTAP